MTVRRINIILFNCFYALSDKGCVASINLPTGKLLWKFKVSNCLVNAVIPYEGNSTIISTMDGKLTCLTIPTN